MAIGPANDNRKPLERVEQRNRGRPFAIAFAGIGIGVILLAIWLAVWGTTRFLNGQIDMVELAFGYVFVVGAPVMAGLILIEFAERMIDP